ncbi:hypothetical protein HPB47_018787, partial [Ixodes persulcatus]
MLGECSTAPLLEIGKKLLEKEKPVHGCVSDGLTLSMQLKPEELDRPDGTQQGLAVFESNADFKKLITKKAGLLFEKLRVRAWTDCTVGWSRSKKTPVDGCRRRWCHRRDWNPVRVSGVPTSGGFVPPPLPGCPRLVGLGRRPKKVGTTSKRSPSPPSPGDLGVNGQQERCERCKKEDVVSKNSVGIGRPLRKSRSTRVIKLHGSISRPPDLGELSRPTFLSALNFWENLQEHPLIVRPNEDSPSHAGTRPMEAAVVGQRAASPTPTTMSQLFLTTSLTTQANTQSDILPSALGTGHPTYTTTDGGDPMDLQAPSGSGNTVKRTHQDPMFQKDIEKLPYPTPSPSQSYRVHIRPLARHDITSVPTKRIQQVIDRCLGTTGYKGYAVYKSTNSITVHLASLTDAQKMCTLTVIPLSEDQQLPRFFYYGRVLHPKPYLPRAIFCYRCYKQGHMQAFCPQRNIDPERTTPEGQPRYRCGLCKSDDHDMTAPNCPMKQKATARLRHTVRTIGPTVPTYNRYQLLDNASEGPLEENTSGSQQPLYSTVLKRNKRPRGRPQQQAEAPHQPEDDIDAQIEALSRELERLRRHKEL